MNDSNGRVRFLRNLYNLRYALEEDPNMKASVDELNGLIERLDVKSLYTMKVGSKKKNNSKNLPHTGGNSDNTDGGGGSDPVLLQLSLRAHAFEVKSEQVIDYKGIPWEPIKVQPFCTCCSSC